MHIDALAEASVAVAFWIFVTVSAFAAIASASFSTMVLSGAIPTRMPETEPIC